MAALLTPDGWAVIEVSNLRELGGATTLAWDIARAVGEILPFAGEIVVHWEGRPTRARVNDAQQYCLLFSGSGRRAAVPGGGAAARGSSGGGSS